MGYHPDLGVLLGKEYATLCLDPNIYQNILIDVWLGTHIMKFWALAKTSA